MAGRPYSQRRIKGWTGAVLGVMVDESGATAIEYTVIVVLVVMALVTLINQIGDFVSAPFQTIASQL